MDVRYKLFNSIPKILIRALVIMGTLYIYYAGLWILAEDGMTPELIIMSILIIPTLIGLFFFRNYGRIFYILFLFYIVIMNIYDWINWVYFDLHVFINFLIYFGPFILVGVYLFLPFNNKIFRPFNRSDPIK